MNRKADIGTGPTWIVASFIIFFLSVTFIIGIVYLSQTRSLLGLNSAEIVFEKENSNYDLAIQKSFESFLIKEVLFEDKKTTIYKVIKESDLEDKEAAKIFNENANQVFSRLLPFPTKEYQIVHPWWIKIFPKDLDRIQVDSTEFHAGGENCNFNEEESLIFSMPLDNKEIVLCLTKSYYEILENNKYA